MEVKKRFRRPSKWSLAESLEYYSIPEPNTGCLLWRASTHMNGYGFLNWSGRPRVTHRLAWEAWRGQIPAGLHVLHKCDVPSCINPNHLFLGTHQDNMKDRDEKGRQYDRRAEQNGRAKLNKEQVLAIRLASKKYTQKRLSEMFSIGKTQVGRIVRGEQWV